MPADRTQPAEVVAAPRRLLGSEVIRKRVDQLLHSSTGPTSASAPYHRPSSRTSNRISFADTHSTPRIETHERKKRPTSYSASDITRSDRAENRPAPTATQPSHGRTHRPSTSMQYIHSSQPEHPPSLAPQRKENHSVTKRFSKDIPDNTVAIDHIDATERDEMRHFKIMEPVFTGPLAVAEFARLKQEIETLKETLHEYKKISRRDKKKLEESQTELNAALSNIQVKESEILTLKDNHRKAEETISTIEHSIQCQICMELPDNPFTLSPCGHTLCLPCLQEWFRKAPPALEDSDIDPEELSDPHYILMRSKSCPSCRARVRRRPVPIFMVKAVASALKNAKSTSAEVNIGSASSTLNRADDDPWHGIFLSSDEEDSDENDESQFDSDEENEVLLAWHPRDEDDEWPGSGSEDEDNHEYEEYVEPRWEPPRAVHPVARHAVRNDDLPEETLKLLMRGCTLEMLDNYTLTYHREYGIALILPGRPLEHLDSSSSEEDSDDEDEDEDEESFNYIFLGWNITLAADDVSGEMFVDGVLKEIRDNVGWWRVARRTEGIRGIEATRLVRPEDVLEYESDETEIWADADDNE